LDRVKGFFDSKLKIVIAIIIVLIIIIGVIIGIKLLSENEKVIRGVDVSEYQGDIDWSAISDQGIYFAYIKATQGTSNKDDYFDQNWKEAKKNHLKVGAYMFVNLDEDAKKQAEFFTQTVSVSKNSLPPVIDFELYDEYNDNPPSTSDVSNMLNVIIPILKEKYNQTPIIYTNYRTYNQYLTNSFSEIPIWICDISNQKPQLSGDHQWVFWQYSQRGILKGYDGDEQFIDMDLFNGDEKAFNEKFN
jgi:lysozyme